MQKLFQRTTEDFVCVNCGLKVSGTGYTNHCPACLCSKHVDTNPGDRANKCNGLMQPVRFDLKKGILHRCVICRQEKYNKISSGDNYDKIVKLSVFGRSN